MDIENILTFLKVAEKQSFSKTAKDLSVTQPAVSKRISALESSLKTKLFDRAGRAVHLTEAGRILLPAARQIQSELTRMDEALANLDEEVLGKLSVATTAYTARTHLYSFLARFRERSSNIAIDLQISETEEILQNVTEYSSDLALCFLHQHSINTLPRTLQSIELQTVAFNIFVSNKHPLASKPNVLPEDLAENKAILPRSGTLARKAINSEMAVQHLETEVMIQADDFRTMCILASMDMGWVCVPNSESDDTLTKLEVSGINLNQSICIVRNHERTLTNTAKHFLETLASGSHA